MKKIAALLVMVVFGAMSVGCKPPTDGGGMPPGGDMPGMPGGDPGDGATGGDGLGGR